MCHKCTQMELEGKPFYCADCGNDVTPTTGIAEWYMVNDDVWYASGATKEMNLCIGCLEKRLKRRLTSWDFGRDGRFPVNAIHVHSPRLRDRLGRDRLRDTIDGVAVEAVESLKGALARDRALRGGAGFPEIVDFSEGYGGPQRC